MHTPSKKTALTALTFALIGSAAGIGGTYYVMHKDNHQQSPTNTVSTTPKNEDLPTISDLKPDKVLPAGTLSPTMVVSNTNQYVDKDIKLRGYIIPAAGGDYKYTILGQEAGKAVGIALDFSQTTVDVKPYISPQNKDGSPVTVSGKLEGGGKAFRLTVSAINW